MSKFGVVGLGSMGKRRVRDLLQLGHAVVGYDVRADRTAETQAMFGISTVGNFRDLIDAGAQAVVISTPPDQHAAYYEACYAARVPFFSEANIFTPRAQWFAQREAATGVKSFPSATWQFYPLFRILRERVREIGVDQVNSVHYHFGGYLPYWHPWENYGDFYAGQKRTSAAREMVPFEMEWLVWVFGPVRGLSAVQARCATWTTDMDDTYLLLLEFESGLHGTLLVELHQVAPFRVGRVACRADSLTLDMASHELVWYSQKADTWRRFKPPGMRTLGSFDFEEIYRAEIAQFAMAVEGGDFPKTWEEDRHLSNILYAAEESWRRKAWVEIQEVESLYDGLSWTKE